MDYIQLYCYNRRLRNIPCRHNCLYGDLCDLCITKHCVVLGNLNNKQIKNLKSELNKND